MNDPIPFSHPYYPELTYRTEGVLWDDKGETDIYYMYWSKPGKSARDMFRLAERFKENHDTWLRDVGPDPE